MVEFRKELKSCVRNLRLAQSDLEKLREIGADESRIRGVMVRMGFAGVTPDEFLSIKTGEDMGRLIVKIGIARLN
ncbi:MAG TPA: hypothetical protein VL793_07510 [Patescibacteria group bacterium]|nr:hypothetical protein [Patescibacteria group bacterium]